VNETVLEQLSFPLNTITVNKSCPMSKDEENPYLVICQWIYGNETKEKVFEGAM